MFPACLFTGTLAESIPKLESIVDIDFVPFGNAYIKTEECKGKEYPAIRKCWCTESVNKAAADAFTGIPPIPIQSPKSEPEPKLLFFFLFFYLFLLLLLLRDLNAQKLSAPQLS